MARSKLPNPAVDLITDGGAVLFSLIMGEQFEYPIDLQNVLPEEFNLYAVVIEANNISSQTEQPTSVEPGGVVTLLDVRVPTFVGEWDSVTDFNPHEMVAYAGKYWIREDTPADHSTPDVGPWYEATRGRIYLRISDRIGTDWNILPEVGFPTYGFLEISLTEKVGLFKRIYKPVRGMVQVLFSPTHA